MIDLNLWDTKGLNLVNPLYGNDPVIQSYGGGPSSILGIGKTKIKFAFRRFVQLSTINFRMMVKK